MKEDQTRLDYNKKEYNRNTTLIQTTEDYTRLYQTRTDQI